MTTVFISHNHQDKQYIDAIKATRLNSNHPLEFEDRSLAEAICNEYGHTNRRPPNDFRSEPVQKEIAKLLGSSHKLLVLVGNDTHSRLWVEWEIAQFLKYNSEKNILVMRTPDNVYAGAPHSVHHLELYAWDLQRIAQWLG
ncbi:TIR domain-containing protein [Photobacterium kagoshimensis]|uniref:TIR domain-containing protein n=1 Tax=Photobacterium kagoshimensis TaxID=2910242 RepID=UPI003D0E2FAA